MKLIKIWSKLGKQTVKTLEHQDAKVFIGDEEYYITGIKYESGKPLGFNAVKVDCSTCANNVEYPPPHTCDVCTSLDTDDYYMWQAKFQRYFD